MAALPTVLNIRLMPMPLRYFLHLLWRPLRGLLYWLQKARVRQCARLDAAVLKREQGLFQASRGARARFDRRLALKRLHCKRSLWQDLQWWLRPSARAQEAVAAN